MCEMYNAKLGNKPCYYSSCREENSWFTSLAKKCWANTCS